MNRILTQAAALSCMSAWMLLAGGSCGNSRSSREITEVRTVGPPIASELPKAHPTITLHAGASSDTPFLTPAVSDWHVPDTWKAAHERPMRLVTFTMGASNRTECYVTVLSGHAGGTAANVNRWRDQMGQSPLDAAAVAALPKLTVLGREATFIEVEGAFEGMGNESRSNYLLLGVICELDDQMVFVKLTGPAAEARAEKARFILFCESLR